MAKLSPVVSKDQPNIKDLPTLPTPGSAHVRKKPWRRTGPRNLKLGTDPGRVSGPGTMPAEFKSGKSSQSEWVLYWAMAKVHNTPNDPRQPPYEGDHGSPPKWAFQKYLPILGVTGKTNIDFIAYQDGIASRMIGIRLESERFHIEADPIQKALDEWLVTHTFGATAIIRVFEQHFMWDLTGHAACIIMAQASKGIQLQGPLSLGNYQKVRV